ncbi:MAG: ribose 5-phosphate isomerase B [Bacillota bacterium]|jgi:ribose 5-phosphate isomerase B|nr:ribose 5-phosphate isomerase B [Bacillota bacterium]NLH87339.1 ribose 5-phosphate isomerase B [Bacillota bacterium]HAN86127.1 ribose 5-phosphate isomerase B [Bacillota bacterium]
MKVAIGSDHAGYDVKEEVLKKLSCEGHEVKDFGTHSHESVDYPDIAHEVAEAVASGDCDRGVLICGTGIGMSIAANKVRGVRAALCHDDFTARMAREHNDANILAVGTRTTATYGIMRMVDIFLSTEFAGGRHANRVSKIEKP